MPRVALSHSDSLCLAFALSGSPRGLSALRAGLEVSAKTALRRVQLRLTISDQTRFLQILRQSVLPSANRGTLVPHLIHLGRPRISVISGVERETELADRIGGIGDFIATGPGTLACAKTVDQDIDTERPTGRKAEPPTT